jgi:hypothetical protein
MQRKAPWRKEAELKKNAPSGPSFKETETVSCTANHFAV